MGIAKNDKGLEEIKTFFSPAIVGIVLINMGSGNDRSSEITATAAFGKTSVDVGIPFQIPAKSMQDQNESGIEEFFFIVIFYVR